MRQCFCTVGFIAPTVVGTGNLTTCERIVRALEKKHDGFHRKKIVLINAMDPQARCKMQKCANDRKVRCFIGLHAFKAGRLLVDQNIPYAIILGGTDVNQYSSLSPSKRAIVKKCLKQARIVVAFSKSLKRAALDICPDIQSISIIPQAVNVKRLREVAIKGMAQTSKEKPEKKSRAKFVFLLPASIRSVKDPFYLAPAFIEWAKSEPRVCLRVYGAPLDKTMVKKFGEFLPGSPIEYRGLISKEQLLVEIGKCVAVLNTSRSEGMSGAILEAMALASCPVVVREIPGNTDIVCHNVNGYVFKDPESFLMIAKELIIRERFQKHHSKLAKREEVIKSALDSVQTVHSVDLEATNYHRLVLGLHNNCTEIKCL
mmetsp:Transcript_12573/g.18799  ORF Transcript_12573/g.18799 Transcript_12573/m.18799 type:complete len:372 (+) Transcript_12573:49-1164(+)